jgi:hypothetical protein
LRFSIKEEGKSNSKTVGNVALTNVLLRMSLNNKLITKEEVYFIYIQKILREIKKDINNLKTDCRSINQQSLDEINLLIEQCEINIQIFLREIIDNTLIRHKTNIQTKLKKIRRKIENLPEVDSKNNHIVLQEIKRKIKDLNFDQKSYTRLVDTTITTAKNYMVDTMEILDSDVFTVKRGIGWELLPKTNIFFEKDT